MSDTILIIATHPDDEILGIGGTAARQAAEKDDVHVLIVAEGGGARHINGKAPDTELQALQRAACEAATILGTCPPRFTGFPDNRLDEVVLLDCPSSYKMEQMAS